MNIFQLHKSWYLPCRVWGCYIVSRMLCGCWEVRARSGKGWYYLREHTWWENCSSFKINKACRHIPRENQRKSRVSVTIPFHSLSVEPLGRQRSNQLCFLHMNEVEWSSFPKIIIYANELLCVQRKLCTTGQKQYQSSDVKEEVCSHFGIPVRDRVANKHIYEFAAKHKR